MSDLQIDRKDIHIQQNSKKSIKMSETSQPKDNVFTPSEFEQVSKYLIGSQIRPYPNVIVPQSNGIARVQSKEELMIQRGYFFILLHILSLFGIQITKF